jgi:hypothetical protein
MWCVRQAAASAVRTNFSFSLAFERRVISELRRCAGRTPRQQRSYSMRDSVHLFGAGAMHGMRPGPHEVRWLWHSSYSGFALLVAFAIHALSFQVVGRAVKAFCLALPICQPPAPCQAEMCELCGIDSRNCALPGARAHDGFWPIRWRHAYRRLCRLHSRPEAFDTAASQGPMRHSRYLGLFSLPRAGTMFSRS